MGKFAIFPQCRQMWPRHSPPPPSGLNHHPPEMVRQDDDGVPAQCFCGMCVQGCHRALRKCANPLGASVLLLVYTTIGAFVFLALERNSLEGSFLSPIISPEAEITTDELNLTELRSDTIRKMWKITETLNVLYEANWTAQVAKEMEDFQSKIENLRGNAKRLTSEPTDLEYGFAQAFFYALTLITTIGELSCGRNPIHLNLTLFPRQREVR